MESINLNLIPQGANPVVHAKQFDEGRGFRFNLFNGTAPIVLTGAETITCNVKKPDGNLVTVAVTNTSSNYVEVYTTLQMCACYGANLGEIRLEEDGNDIGTLNFTLSVEESPLNNGIESESSIHNLESMVDGMVAEEVATQYDSANVIFDNAPTSGHGTPYTVTSEGIKTAIDNAFDYDNTASGSLVHIEDGADNIPVKSLVSEIVAVETGNGQPKSPTNPYTISGFDIGIITRCGKNIADVDNSGNFTRYDGATRNGLKYDRLIGTFAIQRDSNSQTVYYAYQNSSGVWVEGGLTGSTLSGSFTSYGGVQIWSNTGTIFKDVISGFQLEVGNQATTFEAYNGNTYTFTFGQTVFGGHFDNKGNLVVTHGFVEITGTENLYLDTAPNVVALSGIPIPISQVDTSLLEPMSNIATYSTQGTGNFNNNEYGLRTTGIVYYKNTSCTTLNDFKTFFGNNHLQICYKLATPITLAITSQDIPTLLGENNIFSNCGDIEVTYYTNKANDILDFINSEIDKKNGTNILIEENSQDSIKDYIDNVSLSGLPDTDISGESVGQVLTFDGDNWVNANQIVVKYEEKDIAFDSSGEGTLYYANGYILGLKDIPSDSLYIGYITYMAGTKTMVKGFNRSATGFDSSSIANTTRRIGIYYLDYITTE